MIPVRLVMRNFMCYREPPPLHFGNMHLACLSGDNGNGKSALIDAMTWALWGKARANSDDDLISMGQTEMEVEFDFAIGEQVYRIIRKRSRAKSKSSSGQSALELHISSSDGFKPITGNSIAQTQQKIVDLLHMNYDTFVNSAYLRQGHADEFTIKRPAQRKEVLAYILGLSRYDELEAQAKEMAKQREMEKEQLDSAIREIQDELAQKPAYEAELERVQAELNHVEGALAAQEVRVKEIRQKKEILEQKQAQLEQLESHLKQTARDAELWEEQWKQHQARIREYEELIAQRSAIEEGYSRFSEARQLNEELNQKLRMIASLKERKHQLENVIAQAGQELIREYDRAQTTIKNLEAESQKLPDLRSKLQQIQEQLHHLSGQEKILSEKKQGCQELQKQISQLEAGKSSLEREIGEIEEKLSLLSGQTEAKCPLCETELGREGIKRIEIKYAGDRRNKTESLKSNQEELVKKKNELAALQNETNRMELLLNQERATAQSNAKVLEKEIAGAEDANMQLTEKKQALAEIEQRLARKDFAIAEQQALAEIEAELSRLKYDEEQHEQARQSVAELERYDHSKRKLDEAIKLIKQERDDATRAEQAAQKLRQSLDAEERKRQELARELVSLPQILSDLAQAEAENQELTKQRSQVQEAMWGIRSKLQHLSEQEAKKKEKAALLTKVASEESIYKELAKALGKGGVQGMLIETALPEIEDEANRLLGRMTDNRMHLKLEPQKETKKGNVIETLDINISDELGTRNYEMFSGGEAFRINFAVRVALSKLLAKRAGTPLRTLIIDEGFGTQDSTGIEKLKEAINSIQDDFDKILVITHIEELRDSFPVRIDVVKTAEGSTISVN